MRAKAQPHAALRQAAKKDGLPHRKAALYALILHFSRDRVKIGRHAGYRPTRLLR
jgi:hypothetical protein